jgi:hypothetical protein
VTTPAEHEHPDIFVTDAWRHGYDAGHADALAEIETRGRTVLALVDRPWRAVAPGMLIAAPGGTPWLVWSVTPRPDGRLDVVTLAGGVQSRAPGGVDPDQLASVWVPMPEHIALSVLREHFTVAHLGQVAA